MPSPPFVQLVARPILRHCHGQGQTAASGAHAVRIIAAEAYVFNATVVPPNSLGYLTLWPDGQQQPVVSTLNAIDGAAASNLAIVSSTNGSIDAFAYNQTQLILDISSYFAP